MGSNNTVLTDTSDISVSGVSGTESTSGVLFWADGAGGGQSLAVNVKPHSTAWEVEKRFTFIIYNVRGSSTGSGDISPTAGSVTVVVSKTV